MARVVLITTSWGAPVMKKGSISGNVRRSVPRRFEGFKQRLHLWSLTGTRHVGQVVHVVEGVFPTHQIGRFCDVADAPTEFTLSVFAVRFTPSPNPSSDALLTSHRKGEARV